MTEEQIKILRYLGWVLAGVVGNLVLLLAFAGVAKLVGFVPSNLVILLGFVTAAAAAIIISYQNKWAAGTTLLVNIPMAFPVGLGLACYVTGRCL